MKTIFRILAAITIFSLVATGCVAIDSGVNTDWDFDNNNKSVYGSGDIIILNKAYSDFERIEASHTFSIKVTKGDNYSVVINIDDNLIDYLEVSISRSTLKLGMENGYNYKNATIEAKIIMPDIESLELSGASYAFIDGFTLSHGFGLELSGASSAEGRLNTDYLLIDLSGASSINLEGYGEDIVVDCSGASNLNLLHFECVKATIDLSGASIATLNASGTISAELSGASVLRYTGNPEFSKLNISGSSKVVKL